MDRDLTFGSERSHLLHGKLGHGVGEDEPVPRLVEALAGHQVIGR